MEIARREMLATAGVLAAAPAWAKPAQAPVSLRAEGASPAFRAAFDRLVACAQAELQLWSFPGMSLALLGPKGEVATAGIGYANLDARQAVSPDQLFQVGSISKSFVAVALLRLADQGRIDLDRPVLEIAPDMPVADTRVTTAQIISHAAGFPGNAPPFPREGGGKLWSGSEPGSRFAYSNSGYDALALLIERASGMPSPQAVQTLVIDALGMGASRSTIRREDRGRFARGYLPLRQNVAWFPGDAVAEGPWIEIDRAAGSVASTPADMARYMAFIGACATGRPQKLLSPASAARFAGSAIVAPAFGPEARYGMGLATFPIDGAPVLHHTGGMITFSSAMTVDRALGAGAYASVNITGFLGYRPRKVTAYGVQLLRALAAGGPLPALPVLTLPAVEAPADYTGRWLGPDGLELTVAEAGGQLAVSAGGLRGRMKQAGARLFATDHPRLFRHLLAFEGEKGRAEQLWWGDRLLARDTAPAQPAPNPDLLPFAGRYNSNDPWVGEASFVVQGDRLVYEGAGAIVRHADGSWRFSDPDAVNERVWFDAVVNGRAQRASLSGEPLIRLG